MRWDGTDNDQMPFQQKNQPFIFYSCIKNYFPQPKATSLMQIEHQTEISITATRIANNKARVPLALPRKIINKLV